MLRLQRADDKVGHLIQGRAGLLAAIDTLKRQKVLP
jgi:hypothetical protein